MHWLMMMSLPTRETARPASRWSADHSGVSTRRCHIGCRPPNIVLPTCSTPRKSTELHSRVCPAPALAKPGTAIQHPPQKPSTPRGTGDGVAEQDSPDDAADTKSDAYSQEMQVKMGGSLQYRHELGINFHRILPDLYVGSCMQTAADVHRYVAFEQKQPPCARMIFCDARLYCSCVHTGSIRN